VRFGQLNQFLSVALLFFGLVETVVNYGWFYERSVFPQIFRKERDNDTEAAEEHADFAEEEGEGITVESGISHKDGEGETEGNHGYTEGSSP